jgi:hypothetical protein
MCAQFVYRMFVVLCVPLVRIIGCINERIGAPDHQYHHTLWPALAPQAQFSTASLDQTLR